MTIKLSYMGVDGCRAGWFCVELGENTQWRISVAEDKKQLVSLLEGKLLVLIDIPIGLLQGSGQTVAKVAVRECDKQARQILGRPRSSSVFPVPARAALSAKHYHNADAINRKQLGRGLSKQTWNIMPKIKVIDDLLRENKEYQRFIRECHPEICFWSLNDRQPMMFNKKTSDGYDERLKLLRQYLPISKEIVSRAKNSYKRNQVALDDVLDALVCAVTAKLGFGRLCTLPSEPPLDKYGLAMEMVYMDISKSTQTAVKSQTSDL